MGRIGVRNRPRSFDPRRHWRETEIRLILGGIGLLIVVGGGLVWVFYGRAAAFTTVACLLVAVLVLGLLWLVMSLLERWVREDEP
jgi:hypothetical protein